jgi:hypothetical protein
MIGEPFGRYPLLSLLFLRPYRKSQLLPTKGLLWREGLLDVHAPLLKLVRPCIFKPLGWSLGRLSAKEWLQAFNSLLSLDAALLVNARAQELLGRSLSPTAISAIFHIIWSDSQGGGGGQGGRTSVRGESTAATNRYSEHQEGQRFGGRHEGGSRWLHKVSVSQMQRTLL